MLSNPLQYAPQSLIPQFPGQFPGLQAAGWPQVSAGFAQPGAFSGTAQFGQPDGQAGLAQLAANPYLQGQWHSPFGHNPFLGSFAGQAVAGIPAHQIVPVLGQLAQQIAVQNAVTQQIGVAVHQLAHQLASQGLQGYPGNGFGVGQGFGAGGQPYNSGAGQPFGLGGQGPYGGFNPQAQGWGQPWGARPQTIQ